MCRAKPSRAEEINYSMCLHMRDLLRGRKKPQCLIFRLWRRDLNMNANVWRTYFPSPTTSSSTSWKIDLMTTWESSCACSGSKLNLPHNLLASNENSVVISCHKMFLYFFCLCVCFGFFFYKNYVNNAEKQFVSASASFFCVLSVLIRKVSRVIENCLPYNGRINLLTAHWARVAYT